MTAAASASTQANVAVVMIVVIAFTTCVVLWVHERRWDQHDAELHQHAQHLATLAGRIQSLADFLEVDVHDAVDDSPEALQVYGGLAEVDKADDDTDEFPAVPATEPSGIPLQVQSALIEARPSPVPRGKSADWVEDAIKGFNFTGRGR
jgi:uncharacterized membrane protein